MATNSHEGTRQLPRSNGSHLYRHEKKQHERRDLTRGWGASSTTDSVGECRDISLADEYFHCVKSSCRDDTLTNKGLK
jgi:hypothetical protein